VLRIEHTSGGSNAIDMGEIPFAVAAGLGAVWLTDLVESPVVNAEPEAGQLVRLDPDTGRLEDVIPVGKRPSAVATGGGSVWVANGGETSIWRIDPRTNEVVDTIPTPYYPWEVVYGHGHLWVALFPEPFSF
jgi:YVTN family beta-propeller protein